MESKKFYIYEKNNYQDNLREVLMNEPQYSEWKEIANEDEEEGLRTSIFVWKPNNLTDE